MTYDNTEEVKDLAKRNGFMAKPVPMKNTHHATMTELVIGRNLDWMSGINRVLELQAEYKVKRRKKSLEVTQSLDVSCTYNNDRK